MPNPSIEEIERAIISRHDRESDRCGSCANAHDILSRAVRALMEEAEGYREAAERADKLLRTLNSHAAVEASAILREAFEIRPRKKLQGAARKASLSPKLSAPASGAVRRK